MAQPEIAILVSTFERPRHLRRVLASIAAQQGVERGMEVVVTDDGSRDETADLVQKFAGSVSFPVHFTTHRHEGFHIARCRNEGVRATSAPYLLFLDGDCIIPLDHVRTHLERRSQHGDLSGHHRAMAGYPIYFDEATSNQISEDNIASGDFMQRVTLLQRLGMRWRHVRGLVAQLTGDTQRPKLLGGNLGIARADYERVNGYDENYRGWGCEDDDLRQRLCAAGVQISSIAWWTHTCHLWHPKTPSAPATWRAGANVEYFRRPMRLTRCLRGMTRRRLQDLHVAVLGRPAEADLSRLPLWCRMAARTPYGNRAAGPELEIAFAGQAKRFSRIAECRVLVVIGNDQPSRELIREADVVFADRGLAGVANQKQFPLNQLEQVLSSQLGHDTQTSRATAEAA